MFILARYVIREHVGPFFFALALITSMLLLNFVLQAMRYIIGKGIGAQTIIEFIIYHLAGILVLVVPMAVLVATIMAFGRLASDNEITATKAGGINFLKLLVPVVLVAAVLTYGLFVFNDRVLPVANHNARVLKKNIQAKRPTLTIEPGVFLEGIENFSMIVENKDELDNSIYGITIFDKSDRNANRTIVAEKGHLAIDEANEDMVLSLENGEIHEISPSKKQSYERIYFTRYKVIVPVENLALKKSDESFRNEREKTIPQLMEEIYRHQKEKDRQLGMAFDKLSAQPDAAGSMDPRARTNLRRLLLAQTPADKFNDAFMAWNLKWAIDTARIANYEFSSDLKAYLYRSLQDSARGPSSVPMDPIKPMKRSDSSAVPAPSIASQVSANLNTASSYQRLIDQNMVEVNKKYAIPMACVIFVLLGAPLGVKARRGNLGIAAGISLFFFIAYYFCLILGEDLADRQLLNPFFAMWFMNFVLGAIGIVLIYQTVTERRLGMGAWLRRLRFWSKTHG